MRRDRLLAAVAAAICFGAVIYAVFWLEGRLGLEPCPLCMLDRAAFALAGTVFVLAALHGPGAAGQRIYAILALVPLAAGIGIAGRHVWLQHLPADQVPACGPDLEYILESFPFTQALDLILRGSGSCAEIQWRFVGLSIAEWTLVLFVGLALLAAWLLLRPVRA